MPSKAAGLLSAFIRRSTEIVSAESGVLAYGKAGLDHGMFTVGALANAPVPWEGCSSSPRLADADPFRRLGGVHRPDGIRGFPALTSSPLTPNSRGLPRAQMAELVDAPASGAGARKGVEVRVLFWAPISRRLRRPPPSALRLRTIGPDLPEGETAGGRFRDEVRRRVAGAVGAAFPD